MPLRAMGEAWKLRVSCVGRRLVGTRVVVVLVGRIDLMLVVAGLEMRVVEVVRSAGEREAPMMARGVRDNMLSRRFNSMLELRKDQKKNIQ